MPRREDERHYTGTVHPPYCTCVDCTNAYLRRHRAWPGGLWGRLKKIFRRR